MLLSVKELRKIIRHTIAEAAHWSSTLGENVFLVQDGDGQFYLYDSSIDPIESGLLGGIVIRPKGKGWHVDLVWAQHGFGPLLYKIAMEFASQRGIGLRSNYDNVTSNEAQSVWEKFKKDPSVKWTFEQEGAFASATTQELQTLSAKSAKTLEQYSVSELLDWGFDNVAEGSQF